MQNETRIPSRETESVPAHSNGREKRRVGVAKTYKLYIDGKFPRTESGRTYLLKDGEGKTLANICRASRKDFRDSVVAARKAQAGWAKNTAYNRGQVLYRIAEMLEGRKAQFIAELAEQGADRPLAESEVHEAIDTLVYYAGWCDKFMQVFSSVNPVSSSHFNFSMPEPMGVVSVLSPHGNGLAGMVSCIAPAIAGGNTVVILASQAFPISALSFAEVLHSSDVPGGVVNILTGIRGELMSHFSSHMDVNAVVCCDGNDEEKKKVQENASLNVKRAIFYAGEKEASPYRIMDLQEIKTTWHPVGN